MEEDDFSFDFESKLEEQQRKAAANAVSSESAYIPSNAAVPMNQSAGSFKRNFRQTVCTYWLKGVCALGDKCGFLHEYNAERMPVCKTLIKFGICKEPDCPFKHTLDDIKECNMFKLGFCVYGPQCRYRHTRQPGPPPQAKDIEATRMKDLKAPQERADSSTGGRGRSWGGGGRHGPRPPPGSPPRPRSKRGREFGGMENLPAGSIGFGHGMGMPGMMPGMVNQMPMGMPFPFWGPGNGMFPPFHYP